MENTFPITVDYSKTLAEMIAAGKYDYANLNITSKRFPAKDSGKKELVPAILHYAKPMSSEDVIREMDKRGLRPATIHELCVYGEKYPDEQRKYPIVALGSVWRVFGGLPCGVYLDSYGSERLLDLSVWGDGWHGDHRFLAFRK